VTDDIAFDPDWFSKPGDTIVSLMERRQVTPCDLGGVIGGGMDTLRGILAGSITIDAPLARDLSNALGGSADFWLRRQANYDRALDRVVRVATESEGERWLELVPFPGRQPRARPGVDGRMDAVRRRLVFFDVNNLRTWTTRYGSVRSDTQFRTSPTLVSNEGAVAVWLRRGELDAALVVTRPWDADALRGRLDEIRALSRIGQPSRFLPKLRDILASVGVALVVVRAPTGCRASGAMRPLASGKRMLLLSFRFRADDQFWFTVFHELGHLLLHDGQTFVDDEETLQDGREQEANAFARDCIVLPQLRAEFERLLPSRKSILRFSVYAGISAGLTVGQMQHGRMIGHEQFNSLKRRWTWDEIEPALGYPGVMSAPR
jgi:HTH-type transcriptional regulator/antitoxin HigA